MRIDSHAPGRTARARRLSALALAATAALVDHPRVTNPAAGVLRSSQVLADDTGELLGRELGELILRG